MTQLLVADDEPTFAKALSGFLTRHCGYAVSIAFDGHQAMQRLRGEQTALVIMDLKLPGLHGEELIRQMRRMSPQTKVLILTAYRDEALREKFLRNKEVVGYLFKPLSSLLDLERMIREAIGSS